MFSGEYFRTKPEFVFVTREKAAHIVPPPKLLDRFREGLRSRQYGRQHSTIHALAEHGATPNELKAAVLNVLSPYFSNPGVLDRFALAVLVPDAVVLSQIQGDSWSDQMLRTALGAHRSSFQVHERAAVAAYGDWEQEIQKGLSRWWSSFHLELDKTELPLDEYVHEVTRNTGAVIEACLQPILRELLQIIRVGRRKHVCKNDIADLDFGVVVGELIDTSGFPDLFQPPPWQIRISQWRNMCQHFSLAVQGQSVVGIYGPVNNRRSVFLTRKDLLEALQRMVMIYGIVKQARTIFILDNAARIGPSLNPGPMRVESGIVCFASAVATQGFELTNFNVETDSVQVTVRDVTDGNTKQRMLHASQFVATVWYHFPRKSVTVVYQDKKGCPHLTTVAKGEDCQQVSEDKISVEEFANRVQLIQEVS